MKFTVRSFVRRLDRLVDRIVETDALIGPSGKLKLVTLKAMFENLRYYPVLAFMWLGVRLLREGGGVVEMVGACTLGAATIALGILVLLQTAFLLLGAFFSVTTALLAPRRAVALRRRLRTNERAMKGVAFGVVVPLILLTYAVGGGLLRALARAGLL